MTLALLYAGDGIDQAVQVVSTGLNASVAQVAGALTQIGYSAGQIASMLQSDLSATQAQIYNAFQSIGEGGQNILDQVANFFNSGSYTISTTAPWSVPLVMDVSNGSQDPSASVIQWTWNGGHNQDWYVLPTDSGYAELVNRNRGQCLTVNNSDGVAGESLVQYPCLGVNSQQWYLGVSAGNSNVSYQTHVLTNRNSGLVADVSGASYDRGTSIEQWYENDNWNQQWYFSPAIG